MKLVNGNLIIEDMKIVKKNQRRYNIYLQFANSDINEKTLKYKLNKKNFKSFVVNFYEKELKEKFKTALEEEVSFERIFENKEYVPIDINDNIYLIAKLLKEINKTQYRNIIEDKELRIHFDFKEKWYSIAEPHSKRLCKNDMSYNVFSWIYDYFSIEIEKYENLNDKDKLIKICRRYGVKVDFTKRKYSFSYYSNHIILSETINFKHIVLFFERENTMYTESVLKYFAYYIMNKEDVLYNIWFHMSSKGINAYIPRQVDRELPIDKKISNLISDLKPAKSQYTIDKLKGMENVQIDRISLENEEYIIFNLNINENSCIDTILLNYISNYGKFIYNYTNNNPIYRWKTKQEKYLRILEIDNNI